MQLPKIKIPKKFIISIIILLALILTAWQIIPRINAAKYTAEEIIESSISNLQNAPALKFTVVSTLTVDDNTREYGNINGEILKNGDFHIAGNLLGSQIQMYQIGDDTYRLDTITDNWQKTEENAIIYNTALFNETNPLQQFEFSNYTAAQIIDIPDEKALCVKFCPNLEAAAVSQYFTNLTYTIYCDTNLNLYKTVISGDLTNNSVDGKLEITTTFEKLAANYQIEPPIIN